MTAACAGAIMLQETYDQDIAEFSKGHLHIKSDAVKSLRKIDTLKLEDLLVMSNVAFNYYKWYDTALKYLKEAINMFYSYSESNSSIDQHPDIESRLVSMKKEYPLYHNDMFDKKENFIGPDWKMFPHKVDIGSNNFVENSQISINQDEFA